MAYVAYSQSPIHVREVNLPDFPGGPDIGLPDPPTGPRPPTKPWPPDWRDHLPPLPPMPEWPETIPPLPPRDEWPPLPPLPPGALDKLRELLGDRIPGGPVIPLPPVDPGEPDPPPVWPPLPEFPDLPDLGGKTLALALVYVSRRMARWRWIIVDHEEVKDKAKAVIDAIKDRLPAGGIGRPPQRPTPGG